MKKIIIVIICGLLLTATAVKASESPTKNPIPEWREKISFTVNTLNETIKYILINDKKLEKRIAQLENKVSTLDKICVKEGTVVNVPDVCAPWMQNEQGDCESFDSEDSEKRYKKMIFQPLKGSN